MPPILQKLAAYGLAEAEYLLGLIGPPNRLDIQGSDDQNFILASYSLGYRWLRDHQETAKLYFERACGFHLLSLEDEKHQHAYDYLNSFANPCALLDALETPACLDPEADCLLPYMDFLWSIIDDSEQCVEDLEEALRKRASEKTGQPDAIHCFETSEASFHKRAQTKISALQETAPFLKDPELANQITRTLRCAYRLEAAVGHTLQEEMISSLHVECGRLIEAYFKGYLNASPPIPAGSISIPDVRTAFDTDLALIYKQQGILLNITSFEHSIGYNPDDEEIKKYIRFFQKKAQKKFDAWPEKKSYRTFLITNLWLVCKKRSHPWRENTKLAKMDLPSVKIWYDHRNDHAHTSVSPRGTPTDRRSMALKTFDDVLDWLQRIA